MHNGANMAGYESYVAVGSVWIPSTLLAIRHAPRQGDSESYFFVDDGKWFRSQSRHCDQRITLTAKSSTDESSQKNCSDPLRYLLPLFSDGDEDIIACVSSDEQSASLYAKEIRFITLCDWLVNH